MCHTLNYISIKNCKWWLCVGGEILTYGQVHICIIYVLLFVTRQVSLCLSFIPLLLPVCLSAAVFCLLVSQGEDLD